MTPEEVKVKKAEHEEKHQELKKEMADAKKLVDDIIAKAKAKEKAVKK